ncbi:FecR family protein [Novosphingobium gossypii]|uniref:FecR family protein n=1 Tax=Novosphingobium gossypii TaxID=1604774 RepID=UPI003D20D161
MVRRAAQWAAEIDGGITPERAFACEAWCDADARHRLALERMRGVETHLAQLDAAGQHVLSRSSRRASSAARASVLGSGVLAITFAGWLGMSSLTLRQYWPEQRSGTGMIRSLNLEDGSVLDLDTATSIDTRTTTSQRRIGLFHGQVMAHVAKDPDRPFVVETREGRVIALGTVFSVRRDQAGTVVTVIESRVRVCARRLIFKEQCLQLRPGQRARIASGTITRLDPVSPDQAAAWTKGWLEADDMPVGEVLLELNRYRVDPVRFDSRALAGLRITGSFPLADPDRALSALAAASGLTLGQTGASPRVSRFR